MDWPQHDEFDFDCDFDESFDVNFKIPGPPLDIFNTSPQRDRGVGPVSRTFPRPPVAPIRFKNLKSSLSSALEERQSAPTFPSPGRVYEPKARTFHHTFKTAPSLPVNQERPANSNLVSVMQLSNPKFEKLFNFKFFNKIQSQSFDDLYLSDRNIVLSAPTGGGKTVVMELAMLRMFSKKINDAKVIYIAPTKALCEERQRDWEKRFGVLGISCKSLTGDTESYEISKAQSSQIIVTTPEKWDAVLRQSKDTHRLMKYVHLILVDEIHCIKDGVRGATLEAVVTRMKSLASFPPNENLKLPPLRIVGVSATVPNLVDFASWLTDSDGREAVVKSFGIEYRPVKIDQYVIGLSVSGSIFQFEDTLKYKLTELIRNYANHKPTLVFCSTRKSSMSAAEYLANDSTASELFLNSKNRQALANVSKNLLDKRLAACVGNGVGFHHGALSYQDRQTIEGLFLKGDLQVICTTSTLAVGVNLPAHLVIIKGTHHYDFVAGKHVEYSDLDVLQMVGRAGRPQFDNSATAVILTTADKKEHYENMGEQVIESCLHQSLIEHLNAEIALGNITTEDCAMKWLKSTFLYVRIKRNPSFYRLKNCSIEDAKLSAESRLESIFIKDLELLKKSSLVTSGVGNRLEPQEYGRIMTSYYLKYKTVDTFVSFKPSASQRDILELLSKSEEFSEIRFQQDKTALNALNKDQLIRFPVKGKVNEVHQKVFLLIQASIAEINLADFTGKTKSKSPLLSTDSNVIMRNARRISTGMINLFLAKNGFYSSVSAFVIAQAINCKMWSFSSSKLRQVEGLGAQYARYLAKVGIETFQKLANAPASQVEMICNRNPPFGRKVAEAASTFPIISMKLFKITPISHAHKNPIQISVGLKLENDPSIRNLKILTFHFLAGFTSGNIIDHRKVVTTKLQSGVNFTITLKEEFSSDITCWVICPEVCGLDVSQTVTCEPKPSAENTTKLATIDSFESIDDHFWDNVDMDALDVDFKPRGEETTQKSDGGLSRGRVQCKHSCKDKDKCKHSCCKEGLSPNPRRRRKQSSSDSKQIPNVAKIQPSLSTTSTISTPSIKKRTIKMLNDFHDDNFSISSGSLSWVDMMDFDAQEPEVKRPVTNQTSKSEDLSIKDLKSLVYSKQSPIVRKSKKDISVLNPISSSNRPNTKSLYPVKPSTLSKPASKKRSLDEERHILDSLAANSKKQAGLKPNQVVKEAQKEVSFDSEIDELASDTDDAALMNYRKKTESNVPIELAPESEIDELASDVEEDKESETKEIITAVEEFVENSLSTDEGNDLFSQESLDLAMCDSSGKEIEKTVDLPKTTKVSSPVDLDSFSSDAKVPEKLDEMSKKALEIFQDLF